MYSGKWRGVLAIAATVSGAVILLRMVGLLQLLELSTLDLLFRLRPSEKTDDRIVIIGIDESDLKTIGKWPIPDKIMAELLLKVKQQKPRAIGLDIYRDLPVEPGYKELVQVFKTTPNLIGIQKVVGNGRDRSIAPPPLLAQLGQISANDLPWDVDGKIRRGFLYLRGNEGETVFSLGFKIAWMYLEGEGISPKMKAGNFQKAASFLCENILGSKAGEEKKKTAESPVGEMCRQATTASNIQLGKALFTPFSASDGGYVGAADEGYQVLLNYRGGQGTFRTISLTDVLENKIDPALMRDRIVLIGSTAKSLKDYLLTPYSSSLVDIPEPMAGIEIHANLISQIVSGALEGRSLLNTLSEPLEWLWILGWGAIGATLTNQWKDREGFAKISLARTTGSVLLWGGSLFTICYIAFVASWWIPVFPPLLALVMSAIVKTRLMLWENLKLSYQEIEEYSRTLEKKVEERTQELKQKNEQLEIAFQQLKAAQKQMVAQEKLAFLGTLTAGIAHEIRNPLNFVKNFATISVDLTQELKEEIENQAEQLEGDSVDYLNEIFADLTDSIVQIEKQGERIEGIVANMMLHSQKETGHREQANINAILTEAVQLAYHSYRAKPDTCDITIEEVYDESLGNLAVIPQDVSRALVNIINNACYAVNAKKKAKNGDFTPQVSVKTRDLGDRAAICIRDNGQGIPPDIQEKIFHPFFTTKPPGEGTGLGLSLTFEIIVGQHQGEIKVDSLPESHAEFTVLLPKSGEDGNAAPTGEANLSP